MKNRNRKKIIQPAVAGSLLALLLAGASLAEPEDSAVIGEQSAVAQIQSSENDEVRNPNRYWFGEYYYPTYSTQRGEIDRMQERERYPEQNDESDLERYPEAEDESDLQRYPTRSDESDLQRYPDDE